ncbi:MAG: Ig-like domain-containing protein, partial [Terracidiphilus sp.]
TVIDPPGTSTTQCINTHGKNFGGTSADSIDTAGDVAGHYLDTTCAQHGFLFTNAGGAYTSLDAAGADSSACSSTAGMEETFCGTGLLAVLTDSLGDIIGGYVDTDGIIHGFVRPIESGVITGLTDPNAGTSGSITGTMATGISSSAGGITIAGTYADSAGELHGFIYSMALTGTTTTLTPAPAPNPSNYGESVTLTASVSSSGGTPPNGETVKFMSGSTSLGTATLTSGVASLTTTALPVGADSITAVYGGDSDFAGSTSTAVSETVNKASSTMTMTSSVNPSSFEQSVTFTATVLGHYGGVATGSVTFSNGSTSLGTASLSGNSASLATTTLPVGADSITAVYSGDSNFTGSTATAVSQAVNQASTTTTLTSSLNPSASGASVTLTAVVSGKYGGTPTGSVSFSNGSTSLGSVSLTGGSAGLTTTTLPVGTDTITAVYGGDTNFTSSTSNSLSQVVVVPNPAPVIGSLSPAFTDAGGATFTLTVNGSGFVLGSTVYWGTTLLTTNYVSSTQLTASVTAADITSAGTSSITVQTPTPGGGTSNTWQFEVDSASGAATGPTFTSSTATVTAGTTASYPVTLPASVTSATVTCLNLPTGATCSYSAGTLTIATTSATPKGTYQITVVFTETVSGAATSWIVLPILLIPLVLLRRKLAARSVWVTACLGLALLAGASVACVGCGGGGSSSPPPPQTHQVSSSGMVSLIVQ